MRWLLAHGMVRRRTSQPPTPERELNSEAFGHFTDLSTAMLLDAIQQTPSFNNAARASIFHPAHVLNLKQTRKSSSQPSQKHRIYTCLANAAFFSASPSMASYSVQCNRPSVTCTQPISRAPSRASRTSPPASPLFANSPFFSIAASNPDVR